MIALVFAAAVFAADASTAAPPPQPAGSQVQASNDEVSKRDPNRMVCHTEERPGSRMGVKECHTQAEWDAREQQMRDFFRNVHDRTGLQGPAAQPVTGG